MADPKRDQAAARLRAPEHLLVSACNFHAGFEIVVPARGRANPDEPHARQASPTNDAAVSPSVACEEVLYCARALLSPEARFPLKALILFFLSLGRKNGTETGTGQPKARSAY